MTPERLAELERKRNADGSDENVYLWLSRQFNEATPIELAGYFLLRDSEVQRRAMELVVARQAVEVQRRAINLAALASLLASFVAVMIALAS